MSLTPEIRARYIGIIDGILIGADLTTVSVKKVRNDLQTAVGYDITPHKSAISDLVRERFDVIEAKRGLAAEEPVPSVETADTSASNGASNGLTPHTNGVKHESSQPSATSPSASASPVKREASSDSLSEVDDSAPPKKKRKASSEDDATLAARLQAQYNNIDRPTRGGGKKAAPAKKRKTPKKKSAARVNGTEGSDVEGDPRKVNRNTGFHKPLNLSPALSSLLNGETQMSRPQVTKKLWEYIKGHDLQDPGDKRFIIVDDKMREVLKQDKVHMFQMTKIVNQHMFNPDE